MSFPKRWRRAGVAGAMLLALSACAGSPDRETAAIIDEPGVPKQLRSRQIIVALSNRLRSEWPTIARDLQAQYGLRSVGEFPLTSIGVQCLVYQVPAERPLDAVIARLKADPRVELVQINQSFEGLQTAPPDPYVEMAYGAKLVRADQAHRVSTGQGVAVAVIDTGADIDHPDLHGRVAETVTFVEGGESSFRADRHGTAVAGIIGARAAEISLNGVAPETRLTVLKACWYPDPAGPKARCSSWTLAKAVDYVISHDIKVMNLSLGGRPDDLLARLLTAAEQRGVIVVAAALEDREDPGFPASLNTVIPVVACDVNGHVALPRWRGVAFAAAAPGVDVVAPVPPTGHNLMSGSSFAAAYVTGIVALLLQQMPQATPDQIRTVLRTSARPVAGSNLASAPAVGLVDACMALAQWTPTLACR